jgi:GcrA cell cycle regulator
VKFDWTSEAIETLHRLTAEGYSASVIGEKMGISKGAVIGKKHRLGACRPHTPRAKPKVTNYVEEARPQVREAGQHREPAFLPLQGGRRGEEILRAACPSSQLLRGAFQALLPAAEESG